MSTEHPKKDLQRNSALRKCFQALVDRKQVNINMEILKLMLRFELQINMESLDEQLALVMPCMLVFYIRNWPGWQKSKEYYSGKLNFREWFLKFRQYIIVRLNFLIKNGYTDVLNAIKAERLEVNVKHCSGKTFVEKGSQTDHLALKGVAPFTVSIECPPKMLGSLVFTDKDRDVILSQHIKPNWVCLSLTELLNWPHVGVSFTSPNFAFKRFNRSEYLRYINLTHCPTSFEKRQYIEEVKIVDSTLPQTCYTLNMLWSYACQYFEILRHLKNLDRDKLHVIEALLDEFLKDIHELNLSKTFATNTSVTFNIGHNSFVRNKKLSKSNKISHTGTSSEIGYCESFVPKIETELTEFNAVQDETSNNEVSFIYLNKVKKCLQDDKIIAETQIPVLSFFCLFCDIRFSSHAQILEHLEKEHGMEPNFVCTKCLRSLTINSLANARWKHDCVPKASGVKA